MVAAVFYLLIPKLPNLHLRATRFGGRSPPAAYRLLPAASSPASHTSTSPVLTPALAPESY
jgi:hypothetical protein